eukprot:TRINITY_DN13720_c0_g1_i2.p1 TRINITY_DN13720_c0_g1~~TRINITY_DN13720_c0_g1_i2.p1  ORF type:complete len:551 (+),score=199.19 TRINITY_DN13720_c0_g1_i2:175-1653(+)
MVVHSHTQFMRIVQELEEAGEVESDEAFQKAVSGGASGVLVVLPADPWQQPRDGAERSAWHAAERRLLSHKLSLPVYFALETPHTHELMAALSGAHLHDPSAVGVPFLDALLSDNHQLVVSAREGTPIKKPTLTNIYGWVGGSVEALPIILVVANYDALAASPTLSTGADANGSGMLGVMQLARAFSKIQRTHNTHWRYNMLFMLADGGSLNHAGIEAWLAEADALLVSSIELVVHLDSLDAGPSDPLYMHASRPRKNPEPQRLYDAWESRSAGSGREYAVNIQKVNVSSPAVRYPHEHFSKKRVFSVTVSARDPSPVDKWMPGSGASVFESREGADVDRVEANINAVGDVLLQYMFPDTVQPSMPVLDGQVISSSAYAHAFADAFWSMPRPPVVLQNATVVDELRKAMESVLVDVVAHEVASPRLPVTLYRAAEAEMHAFVVKPYALEVVLAVLIVLYLLALYVGLRGQAAWREMLAVVAAVRSGGKPKKA